jgi:hypothetical protein
MATVEINSSNGSTVQIAVQESNTINLTQVIGRIQRTYPEKKTPIVKVQDEDYFFHVDKTDEREVLQSFSDSFKGTVGYREGWDG